MRLLLCTMAIVLAGCCSTPPVEVNTPPFGWQTYPTTRPYQWFDPMFDTRSPASPL